MKKYILFFLLAMGLHARTFAQTNTIKGNTAVSVTSTYAYTITSSSIVSNPVWEVTGGLVPYVFPSSDNLNFKCSITWPATGTFTITFKSGSTVIDTHIISVVCTPPSPAFTSVTPVSVKGKVTLLAELPDTYTGNYDFHWYSAASGGTLVGTGSVFVTPELTTTTPYWVATYEPVSLCESSRIQVWAEVTRISLSQTIDEVVRVKGVKTDADLLALTEATQKQTVKSHYDGLMRLIQKVAVKSTPGGNNMVQPVEYDSLGRVSKLYLPYAAANTDGGEYQSAYRTAQANFYNNTTDNVADDLKPYSVSIYEQSPLGRPTKSGAVGDGFQPDQGHTPKAEYLLNDANEVRLFASDGSSTGYWPINKLYKIKSTNAEGNLIITYTSPSGQTILQRQQLDEIIDGVMVTYLDTYYVYDDFGRIKYIFSPKCIKELTTNAWVLSVPILNNYVHQFVYDYRGRVVEKKVPGQAWMYYIYDDLNRLILTQDGFLRAQNKWSFVKYDYNGRAVMSGLYLNATQTTRGAIQTLADGLYTAASGTYGVNAWYESRGAGQHGYTNTSFPKLNADNSALEVLNVNYFDDHDFDNNGSPDYSYSVQSLPNENTPGRTRGLATGSKRLVLGTTTWLYTYVFYDEYRRVIQTRTNNHINPSVVDNLSTAVYLFDGTLTTTKTYHNPGSTPVTVINKFTYDDQGRLKEVKQSNNGSADQIVAAYTYNELGQLVDKKLHNTSGSSYLQSVDYRYTIRGQLKSINNAQLTNDGNLSNDDTGDYFGIEYLYQENENGLNNVGLYNGNISAVKWKGMGTNVGTTDQKSFKFSYDKTGKMETATWQVKGTSTWNKEVGAHNESLAYDHDGNIKALQRNQRKHQLSGTTASYVSEAMDNLTYTYNAANGNALEKVTDAALATGFNNGGSGTGNDFTYDINGNITADGNKGITGITYNFLGKPTQVNFSTGKVINYTYDAAGNKVRMSGTDAGVTTTTDYVGNFVYVNNTLSFFGSPEGRVVKNSGGGFDYEYAIADHQGNTRVLFTSAAQAPLATTATFEGDANDGAAAYNLNGVPVVSSSSANHTSGGSKTIRMNQSYKTGPSKSLKVYPGDKVDMEVWEYHEGSSGFGTASTPLTTLITSVASAFGGVNGGAGESGIIYSGVNSAITAFGTGGNQGDSRPAAYLNYILFDKNFKVLDAGWQLAPATTFTKQKLSFPTKDIKEEGYLYTWLSYDDASNNWVYFDDFKVTHTKSNVLQYNEYYPFGLQTSNSWTRDNSSNNFLYNSGSELNNASGWYETFYRGYDPTLGRFLQIDPLATSEMATYQYAGNNPVMFNDPLGSNKTPVHRPDYITQGRQYYYSDSYWATWTNNVVARPDFGNSIGAGGGYSSDYNSEGINVGGLNIDIDQLSDGAHLFDFSNGQLSNYTYYSDAEIKSIGMSVFGSIVGASYNPISDYTGGARLWGDEAGTVFTSDPNSKVAVAGKKGRSMTIGEAFAPLGEALLFAVQNTFDVVGLIPGAGEFFDLANAGIYALRGDKLNAGLSLAGAVPFLGWGATGAKLANKTYKVYHAVDNSTGLVKYVGITSREVAVREAEHMKKAAFQNLDFQEVATGLSKLDARIMEQTYINQYGLGNLLNKINSIAPSKWGMYGIKP